MKLSEEQIERANTVNLPQFLMQNGFDLKRVGREYVWKEHDSLHIKDNSYGERGVWHRFSTDEGGDNIAFLRTYMGMDFVQAVEALNGEHYDRSYTPQQYKHKPTQQKAQAQELVLSENSDSKRVFAYLCKTRGLDYNMVSDLIRNGSIAQEQKTGNVLFKYFDKQGKVIGADKVGTSTEHRFKGIATGSASGHGFEVCRGNGSNLLFFESSIDALSYLQMHSSELTDHRLVSMMGVKPQTVIDTMERYGISPDHVFLCSDNDKAGNEFAERLMSEYPDMKRVVTPDTYKDWNDMLRGIPKKEINVEQEIEKKEADKMPERYGNEIWNSATDNRNKSIVSVSAHDFPRVQEQLENAGMNYYAYPRGESVIMAINDADVEKFGRLTGAPNIVPQKSQVTYVPPEKNIIGKAEYRYIPQKEYISADRDLVLKMADKMEKQGIQFSGRIYPTGKGTLTVSHNDLYRVRAIRDEVIAQRRQVGVGEKGQTIGNRSVAVNNRQLYLSTLTPQQYEEVKPFIETNAHYSGVIRDDKVMFAVDRSEAQTFHRALETAKREVGLIHTMQDKGLPMEQMVALSPLMHRLAVEDAQLQLSDFFDKRYDEAQFGEMLSLVNAYLDQPTAERFGEHSKLNDMLEVKSSFDRSIELADFFSQHDFSDEQRAAVTAMFVGDVTRGQIDCIDETFTVEDIQQYSDILRTALSNSEIAEYLEQHRQTVIDRENAAKEPTEEEVLFGRADLARFIAEGTLSSDEWEDLSYPLFEDGYTDKHKPNDKAAYGYHLSEPALYDLAQRFHGGEDIRKELALALMEHKQSDDMEFVFEGGEISNRTFYYAENLRHNLHAEYGEDSVKLSFGGMEREVSYDEIGQSFLERIEEEHKEIQYFRTIEELSDALPGLSVPDDPENTAYSDLIRAFEGAALPDWERGDNQPKINRIKKALYDILDDECQTETAFSTIAKEMYNVSFEPEKPEIKPDSLTFRFGNDHDDWISESDLMHDFAVAHPNMSFALGNAVAEYLDEKQHTERSNPELKAGWYKKTDFMLRAVINGEEIGYEGRFDIGDGKGTGGGSLIDHMRVIAENILASDNYPANRPETRAQAENTLNVLIPFLEKHSELTIEEQQILADFKAQNPIRTEVEQEKPEQAHGTFEIYQMKSGEQYHYNRFESLDRNKDADLTMADYDLVYSGDLSDYPAEGSLEAIYTKFNVDHPEDFKGHSLSMSDVIVTEVDGVKTAHYCDDIGFTEFPDFFKEKELVQEQEQEQTAPHKPTVANLSAGDIIMFDGSRREVEEISADSIKLRDLDAPDYGGILLSTSDVYSFDGWQDEMNEKGFEILSKTEPKEEAKDLGPVTMRKVGDFYEMYGKNAEIATDVLDIHLTTKNGEPMVGFPEHVKSEYADKLRDAGYTVLEEQAFEINPPKREEEKLLSLRDVVDKYFGTDCESAETENGTWKLSVADGDKVGELFHNGEAVCGIYNSGDHMEIEPYQELTSFPKLLADAMLTHNPDEPVIITDFEPEITTPLDKAINLINDFCVGEYNSEADFSDMSNVSLAYTTLTDDELPIQVTADLEKFRILYEFDGEVFKTEQYDSIEDMVDNGLTGLDFNDLVYVPDEVIEKHISKGEQTVDLMSDANTVHDAPAQETVSPVTIDFKGDSESLAEMKDFALSLGATVTTYDDTISVSTYTDHMDELLNKAYELTLSSTVRDNSFIDEITRAVEAQAVDEPAYERFSVRENGDSFGIWDDIREEFYPDENGNALAYSSKEDAETGLAEVKKAVADKEAGEWLYAERARQGIEPEQAADDDAPLFADTDVIDKIQEDEKADVPFWETPDIQGEQLTLFGDPEPIQQTAQTKKPEKAKPEFAAGPIVDGVQVYEALAAEIDRGTGFVDGKLYVQEFYDEQHPTTQQLADHLKKAYGIGGHSGDGNISLVSTDGKGMTFDFENGEKFRHSWFNVATMTKARLEDNTYLSAEQQEKYAQRRAEKSAEAESTLNPVDSRLEENDNAVNVGSKFRNKMTGDVSEVISLEGAVPWQTDDVTVTTDKGSYATTENISVDKLLDTRYYERVTDTERTAEVEKPEPVKAEAKVRADLPKPQNLSQLKKAIKPGMMFEITAHNRPECVGERRVVTGVNTVEFTSKKLDENGEPYGKDIFMEFDRAKNWSFDNGEMTSHLEDGSVLMSFHFIDDKGLEKSAPEKAEHIPVYTGEWAVSDNRELFREIVAENERFAKMANEVIGNGKNPVDSVKALVDEFGMERTAFLTALNIVAHPGDGRFYPADKEWACEVLAPYIDIKPDEVIHLTPEKERLFENMINGGTLYSIHNTHLAQFAETLMPEYEKYRERTLSAEKAAPEAVKADEQLDRAFLSKVIGKLNDHYDEMYQAHDNVDGFAEAVAVGNQFIKDNPDFMGKLADLRHDIISSDRETAALAFALVDVGLLEKFVAEPEKAAPEITPEKSEPELSVGDFIEYKGKEYKVEGIEQGGFITLCEAGREDMPHIMSRVTFLTDEFISNAEYKMIEPKTADTPEKGDNFTITDDSLGEGGAKTKFRANVDAIRTLKTLEQEKRPATAEEKETLSKYVGWGGIPQAFDKSVGSWSAEYAELKELLTPQEYRQAQASTLDAFYTSPTIVNSIYEALGNFGFEGGNILEPAMGVGNFFGKMPSEMRENSQLYGVEIDSISGRIAQALYPDADIAIQGFEKNSFQNGCFDVAVGNVPFGDLGFTDTKHNTSKLHDYFFAETIDKIKNGGIIAFVTSSGTLDKKDESVRQMLADKADFIGAVRLPGGKNGAFHDNAGTDVTTDIIFLKKNEGKSVAEMSDVPDWVHLGTTADGLPINQYFANNPDMVLGEVVKNTNPRGGETMVVAEDGFDLKTALHDAVSKLSAEISKEPAREVYAKTEQGLAVKIPSDLRNFSFFMQDDQIFFKKNDVSFEQRFDKTNAQFARYKAFIELRDITRELIEAQELNKSDSVIKDLQGKLNIAYDSFYKKYGLIHSKTNKRYFNEDVSYNLVAGLEKKIDKDKLVEKSDIFTKRTICPPKAVESVETAMEALTLSIAEKAKVDFDYMSQLTGMTEDELKHDLVGEIFKVPHTENEYQTASEYLSGDIRAKLRDAEEVAEYDSDFNINVNALQKAMPEPLKAGDIDVKIGATWLDPKYYDQFMYELLGTPDDNRSDKKHSRWYKPTLIQTEYSEKANSWHISNKKADRSVLVNQKYGTPKMNAYEIFEHLLNLKEPKVYKSIEVDDGLGGTKEKRVVDIDATRVVQKKAKEMKKAFKAWIFKDAERREAIVDKYNELFNSVRPREFDGSHLTFPMMNADIHLHEHQKNAIAHAMFGGNTLFAHSVGAGKTFEMIATAMESKRLGLCTKSLFAVPNHLTEQIGDDFQRLYPGANILVATKKDFQKANRQQLFAKIATGNYDAVIIGHSQLGMIPVSRERQEMTIQSQIDDILKGIEELKKQDGSKFQIKALERTRKSLQKQLDKLQKVNQDDTLTFEQLGIDKLFVDEAHECTTRS